MDPGVGCAGKKILQLRITLKGTRPPVWRRLLIQSDSTFLQLHWAIQSCMGWKMAHLHKFELKTGDIFKTNIVIGKPSDFEFDDSIEDVIDERVVRLEQYLSYPSDRFLYVYDLGDCWKHLVVLEKILNPVPGRAYPVCLKGRLACPPEDCGGVIGYKRLLETIKDPNNEEYNQSVSWLEEYHCKSFDAKKFDPKEVVFSNFY